MRNLLLMKELILGALDGETVPAIIMNGKRDEIFPDPVNFRERLSQYARPVNEVYWERMRDLLRELLRTSRACAPVPLD